MDFRLTKYAGIEERFKRQEAYALEYGLLLMAVVGEAIQKGEISIPLPKTELTGKLQSIADHPLHFAIDDGTRRKLKNSPYHDVKGA
jgi:hypothetical protein